MENPKRIIMAAIIARSNMGHLLPTRVQVRHARFAPNAGYWTLDSAVNYFCQDFMESEEHYDTFMEEAQAADVVCALLSDKEFAETWPGPAEVWEKSKPIRHKQALQIIEGAGNPLPITTALADAVRECDDEGMGTMNVWADPAVKLIIHQMVHLSEQHRDTLMDFRNMVDDCKAKVEYYEK